MSFNNALLIGNATMTLTKTSTKVIFYSLHLFTNFEVTWLTALLSCDSLDW